MMPALSVVSPIYGAERCLDELHRRLTETLLGMGIDYELVFVNDGSPDRSGEVLAAIVARDPRVLVLNLSRNFGQHAAILAGLEHASGELVVVMDCDLQESPEDIPRLVAKSAEGWDVVFARRRSSRRSWFKRTSSRLWFFLINLLSDLPITPGIGTFSLLSRQVVDELVRMPNRQSHYIHLVRWMGFRQGYIDIDHGSRFDGGRSAYSLGSLMRLALIGVVAHSTRLLTLSVYLGFAFVLLSIVQFGYVIHLKVFHGVRVEGWTSLMAALWLVGGAVLSSLGVIGLYVARIVGDVKQQPAFIVRERIRGGESQRGQVVDVDRQRQRRIASKDGPLRNVVEHQHSSADHAVYADVDSVT
jgi:dolichol-phosphate mannosyltransferase